MIGHPKHKLGDVVTFYLNGMKLQGTIEIIDAYGTFEDDSDVSYDIFVTNHPKYKDGVLIKHINERMLD